MAVCERLNVLDWGGLAGMLRRLTTEDAERGFISNCASPLDNMALIIDDDRDYLSNHKTECTGFT